MTGNDLVDLQAAAKESNWKRKGFLHKLFSMEEQQAIHAASIPEEMVWLYWSMKEAAYKIHNQRSGIREFAPIKLGCKITKSINNHYWGQVNIANTMFYTKSTIRSKDYIHTIAADQSTDLQYVAEKIYPLSLGIDYKPMQPKCVSHHGQYLALIF